MKLPVSRRTAVWSAAALALLVGGYFGFHALFVKVSRTVEMPFAGPARHDDYYVLHRYLQERGLRVEATRNWPQPLTPDTAVLWFADDEVPDDVRGWLASGGRLWAFSDPDAEEEVAWSWAPEPWHAAAADGGVMADGGVSADGGVTGTEAGIGTAAEAAAEAAAETETAETEAEAATVNDGADAGVDADDDDDDDGDAESDEAVVGEDDFEDFCRASAEGCLAAAQFAYGTGCLTLVRPHGLQNEQVYLGETPERIDALLSCPSPARRVVIVSSASSPWFGALLLTHAPEALLGAALCLALWLWRAGRHFGPVHAPRVLARRRLLDHVAAVGRLALRVGPDSLIAAARSELRQRLLRRVPGGRELEGAALVAAAVQSSGHSESEVTRALLEPPTRAPGHILAIARSIVALWRTS